MTSSERRCAAADASTAPLLIRFGRIGDMVLQLPLLDLLRRRFGQPCRVLTSGEWSASLFASCADVGDLWQLRARHTPPLLSPGHWRAILRLRKHRGPVYVSEDSLRQLPKIRLMLALARIDASRCLFLDQVPARDGEHWVDQLLRLGSMTPPAFEGTATALVGQPLRAPRVILTAADQRDREAWIAQRGLPGRPLVLLQPGNRHVVRRGRLRAKDPKAWPVANWIELLQTMAVDLPGAAFVACGAPAEFGVLRQIRAAAARTGVEVICEALPLRRLIALLGVARCLISVDTGPAHLAAAVGCPLVVLYGREPPARWSRRSPAANPVIELGGPPQFRSASEIPITAVINAWRLAAGIGADAAHRGQFGGVRRLASIS